MATNPLSVVIHGHFYQPPREDPWLGTLELQPTAAPYHDWNERITDECYRAVLAARVPGSEGRIAEIVDTLRFISFNFGPTLLEWLEGNAPTTYRGILEADGASRSFRRGHGNALAQTYHHTILPLASRREKVSEVRWGIRDFRRRFRRDPAGMWLPETAVDGETLDVLAQEGIAFTILAPHQVTKLPEGGLPGRFRTPGGRSIALFLYDGPLSHGVAFGPFLRDGNAWARAILDPGPGGEPWPPASPGGTDRELAEPETPDGPAQDPEASAPAPPSGQTLSRRLVSMATDGESYGHHHRFGEMALASVILRLQGRKDARLENFASFLARTPPREEVELVEPTSWSCAHGVERWRSNCGCKMDYEKATQQEWRWWLREATEWLAQEVHGIFEGEAPPLLGDPWAARDRYGEVAAAGPTASRELVATLAPRPLEPGEEIRARELLEMENQALRLFTSCGWFFDDLAGLEPVQILRYAARALELTGHRQAELEEGFLGRLEWALSNEAPPRSGREIFLQEAKPRIPVPLRVAAGAAVWSTVAADHPGRGVPGYPGTEVPGYQVAGAGTDRFRVSHRRTGAEWLVETRVVRRSLARLEVDVRLAGTGGAFVPLEWGEIPESYRDSIRRSLLGEALRRWAPVHVREDLSLGARDISRVLGDALTQAVRALAPEGEPPPGGGSPPAPAPQSGDPVLDRVQDLAHLHGLLGLPIPFDAQTELYRLLEKAAPQELPRLDVLREPLGFVTVE
jgi:hypothetical protein